MAVSIKLSAQEYKVELNKYTFDFEFKEIKIDSIIDARVEKKYIGFVTKGMISTVRPAYLEQPLNSYLDYIVKENIHPDNTAEHLILRINKLVITDRPGGYNQYFSTEMNISFIVKQNGKYYEKFRASIYNEKYSGIYSGSIYSKNIGNAFESCIGQYANRKNTNSEDELVETNLGINPLIKNDYRIRTVTRYTKGIYKTYSDFLNYRIDSTMDFKVEYINIKAKSGKAIIKDTNNMAIENVWGFNNGCTNYCKLGDLFYPLQREDSLFSIEHFPLQRDIIIPIVPAFGLLGGLVIALAAEAIQKDGLDNRMESKTKYFLNYNSGRFYPYNEPSELSFESNIVIFGSQFNKAGNDFDLFVNGKRISTLSKNTYCKFSFKSDTKDVDITIRYNGENYSYTSHPLLFNTELLLIVIRGNKVIIDKVNQGLKNNLIKDIDKGKIKKIDI